MVVPASVSTTTTSGGPRVPAGVFAVMEVAPVTAASVAGAPPVVTVAPVTDQFPVMVTGVPRDVRRRRS